MDMEMTICILGTKIYRDRFRRLFLLSQSTCIDEMLIMISMEEIKVGFKCALISVIFFDNEILLHCITNWELSGKFFKC